MMNRQTQESGDNSTNIQGKEITIVQQGVTYSEAKQIAEDVFNSNFFDLAGEAKSIAAERAAEITEVFLGKLKNDNPNGFTKASDPDFQYGIFTVQKEFARTGDKELGDLLVDLLVDRSKQDNRNILQIVLNESLSVAPKLTGDQLATLAVTFFCIYTQLNGIENHKMLADELEKFVHPFSSKISTNTSSYQHMEYTGCGSIVSISANPLPSLFARKYQGLFVKGFEKEEIEKKEISVGEDPKVFIPCLNDESKIQVKGLNVEQLNNYLNTEKINENDKSKIIDLFNSNKMTENEIRSKIISLSPYMSNVFDIWHKSPLKSFSLTSVGIAIGHANIKRLVGDFADLSIWIN